MALCFSAADILLPDFTHIDGTKYACVACDQFTSEPAYWQAAERLVGDAPSTLRMILPECYLEQPGAETRIPAIHQTMRTYQNTLLQLHPDSMIYLERIQSNGVCRRGLIGKVDLEAYDYRAGSTTAIRATEGTVLSRIPPRVRIRQGAPLDLPHAMLLIDDEKDTVLSPLSAAKTDFEPAYDFPLMLGGGAVKGWFLSADAKKGVLEALDALNKKTPLLFAVGDGNHSLAAARACYEAAKAEMGEDALSHPCRYALVEIGNIHDDALVFEPIYRVLFHTDVCAFQAFVTAQPGEKTVPVQMLWKDSTQMLYLPRTHTLTVGCLQQMLDAFLQTHPEGAVDYIHGEDSVRDLVQKGCIGFLFEGMQKEDLFPAVLQDGALPRKTFSMGHARDKRYYLEGRSLCL